MLRSIEFKLYPGKENVNAALNQTIVSAFIEAGFISSLCLPGKGEEAFFRIER